MVPATPVTSASPTTPVTSVTCLFSSCKQKKCGKSVLKRVYPKGDETIQHLQGIADEIHDFEILQKLQNQTIAYNKPCYETYQTNAKQSIEEPADSSLQRYRKLHKLAFESLCNFVDSVM